MLISTEMVKIFIIFFVLIADIPLLTTITSSLHLCVFVVCCVGFVPNENFLGVFGGPGRTGFVAATHGAMMK
jgi:hypothetical protein